VGWGCRKWYRGWCKREPSQIMRRGEEGGGWEREEEG